MKRILDYQGHAVWGKSSNLFILGDPTWLDIKDAVVDALQHAGLTDSVGWGGRLRIIVEVEEDK